MLRTFAAAALLALLLAACEGGADKAKEIGKKIDNAVDKLDTSEAGTYLAQAKEALAKGTEPSEACTWSASSTAQNAAAAARPSIDELKRLCSLDVPLMRATRAVAAAEAARAEQPQAPSLTECSSDEWPKAAARLDKDHPGETRWSDLKARWTKVCPPL
ncbi:MAG TPA: hypothetical protein VM261_32415 [Kofleriaceae bacterium]|nr:hypothetical protein [Kofleriaceae bacterium]